MPNMFIANMVYIYPACEIYIKPLLNNWQCYGLPAGTTAVSPWPLEETCLFTITQSSNGAQVIQKKLQEAK